MAISFGIPTALSIAGTLTISSLSSGILKVTAGVVSVGSAGTDYVGPGAVTTSGLTMATARLLGRTTASTGAIEEITVTSNLTRIGQFVSGIERLCEDGYLGADGCSVWLQRRHKPIRSFLCRHRGCVELGAKRPTPNIGARCR